MSDPRPKNCSHCTKPTQLYLSQVINGKLSKFSLCKDCPSAALISGSKSFDLTQHIGHAPVAPLAPSTQSLFCTHCGFSEEDFKKRGRLGCSRCYDSFATKLQPVLAKVQRDIQHRGKGSEPLPEVDWTMEVTRLKTALDDLVRREEYEQAAEIRDQIKSLEQNVGL